MTTSIKNFASNFQALNNKQLNKVVGGNGQIITTAVGKKRGKNSWGIG